MLSKNRNSGWFLRIAVTMLILISSNSHAAAVERRQLGETFKKQVLDESKGKLVAAIWSRKSCPKCPPAMQRLNNVSKIWMYKDKFVIKDVDLDQNKDTYYYFFQDLKTGRVLESTPTVVFFYNGEQLGDDLGNPDNQILPEELDKRLLMIEEIKKGAARAEVEKKYRKRVAG